MSAPHFLLVGNGPYANRGCEAIVRGTMRILRRSFGDDIKVTLASYGDHDEIARLAATEKDAAITHICTHINASRWSWNWFLLKLNSCFGFSFNTPYQALIPSLSNCIAVLEIGGDNYSLDYGRPYRFMEMDKLIMHFKHKIVLWGASVGPFDADPSFMPVILKHLNRFTAIFVREPISYEYLRKQELKVPIKQIADPAFVMEPIEVGYDKLGLQLPKQAIGLNLCKHMAHYVTNDNMDAWIGICEEILTGLIANFDNDILLIPHVSHSENGDYELLKRISECIPEKLKHRIYLVPDTLNAEESKWVISQCVLFVGVRTHATIAAFSTGVPTVSLAYSIKASGLNILLFGTDDYCVQPSQLTTEYVIAKTRLVFGKRQVIREQLLTAQSSLEEEAFRAGEILRECLK